MRHVKSERLKKLEAELADLEQWLKLGLVPKKDVEKHKQEILSLQAKIEEEKERLNFLKESGEIEEYVTPKKQAARPGYADMPTIPDLDASENATGINESAFEMETETFESSTQDTHFEKDDDDEEGATRSDDDDEESYFSDKNRWRRGGIIDPDADEW